MQPALAAAFDAAFANCRLLSRDQALHFIEHGYARIRGAFGRELAAAVRAQAWRELRDKHGATEQDPKTWGVIGGLNGIPGYVRTAGSGRRFTLRADAPRAFQALADVVGGAERLPADGEKLAWGDGAIANLGGGSKSPPSQGVHSPVRQRSWHKDGWHFRHFLDSPEQGLLVVPIFSDILPRGGGTCIATDSIAPVARLLASNPQGFHADSVQGAGYLIPGLVEQCSRFAELTGETGDMAILHPYMLHRPCRNASAHPRFIANAALVLAEPLRFDRPPGETYSLVELAVLRALDVARFPFETTHDREAFVPGPFRDEAEKTNQRKRLAAEMRTMAQRGVVTPTWGPECGYMSNASTAFAVH